MKIIFLFILSVVLYSCNIDSIQGSDTIVKKKIDIKGFTSIDVSSAFDVELVQSKNYKVILECNDNISEFVQIELDGKELIIGMEDFNSYSNTTLKVIIHAPSIERIEASGASEINFDKYEMENFELDLSGASDIEGKLIIKEGLHIEASGASDMKIRGKTKNLTLDFSGASEFSGKKLIVSDALEIDASGASSISVTANGTIDIDISGASDVKYYGSGTIINEDISGAGSVQKK